MMYDEVVIAQENIASSKQILELISNVNIVYSFLGLALIITMSVVFLVPLRHKLNKDSLRQIAVFERERKYIKELYIELNETQEMLRYFAYSKKWRHRIISSFNRIFNNFDGKRFKRTIKSRRFKISRFARMSKAGAKLEAHFHYFKQFNRQRENRKELGDYAFVLERFCYSYSRKTEGLVFLSKIALSKTLLLIGSAGNGKTNALCKFADMTIKSKNLCIFINAKDIKNEKCYDYFIKRLCIPELISSKRSIYIFIANILLAINRKSMFVVIDAINENDNPEFVGSLGEFIHRVDKYKRIRILMSCRSEYLEARYKRCFESCVIPPPMINTREFIYSERAKMQVLTAYAERFNFTGRISTNAKRSLFKSLILLRIFFEVYENKSDVVVDLNNYEIYQKYVQKLIEQSDKIDLQSILDTLILKMIENAQYDGVEINELNIVPETYAELKNILDYNFLISKSLVENEGLITEKSKEYLYFVFDELRDFCLSRHLLSLGDKNEYSELFLMCNNLYQEHKSPLEGILKYSYAHFKKTNQSDYCKLILNKYCNESVHYWKYNEQRYWHEREKELFNNFGVTIIFNDIENIADFEKCFILEASINESRDFWQMFFYFMWNELEGLLPDSSFIIDIVCMIESIADFDELFKHLVSERYKRYYTAEDRLTYHICEFINHFKERNLAFSNGIKQMLLLISVADPYGHSFDEYIAEIMNDTSVVDQLVGKINIKIIKDKLLKIKGNHN